MEIKVNDSVECIDVDGIPKAYALEINRIYCVRSIGERTNGVRLQGINLYSDTTGYEKCYNVNRFKVV